MPKFSSRSPIKTIFFLLLFLPSIKTYAQSTSHNKYGLQIISNFSEYLESIQQDANNELVDLTKQLPGISLDIRYAGDNNFMKTRLYAETITPFLRKPVANALSAIQKQLKKKKLGLLLFDAYRPYAITERMWELIEDERYVANPKNGSGHNRGISVDLSIINLKNNQPLPMGTDFDNFSDSAHHSFTGLSKEVLQNRLLLRTIMEKNGFKALETEWWHYSFENAVGFGLLDLDFEKLK